MKTDELALFVFIAADGPPSDHWPRKFQDIPDKRKWYILDKWARKGYYEYGVTLDLGWITPAGRKRLNEVLFTEVWPQKSGLTGSPTLDSVVSQTLRAVQAQIDEQIMNLGKDTPPDSE